MCYKTSNKFSSHRLCKSTITIKDILVPPSDRLLKNQPPSSPTLCIYSRGVTFGMIPSQRASAISFVSWKPLSAKSDKDFQRRFCLFLVHCSEGVFHKKEFCFFPKTDFYSPIEVQKVALSKGCNQFFICKYVFISFSFTSFTRTFSGWHFWSTSNSTAPPPTNGSQYFFIRWG